MTDDRSPPSELRGRLADIYVPALISGTIDALCLRLGNRATVDDPQYGRASSIGTIEPLLRRMSAYFAERGATYEHVYSTTGVDRDASEGRVTLEVDGKRVAIPIAVVAERRRLREIELRVYYTADAESPRPTRSALVSGAAQVPASPCATLIEDVLASLRTGDVDGALAGFEDTARLVDATGRVYTRHLGILAAHLADLGELDAQVFGVADDSRTACVEIVASRSNQASAPSLLSFTRGDTGRIDELRLY